MCKLLKNKFMSSRQEQLQLWQTDDDSFLVAFESDVGFNPELLVGCIGQWINTDDLEYAFECFNSLVEYKKQATHMSDVTSCMTWRDNFCSSSLRM